MRGLIMGLTIGLSLGATAASLASSPDAHDEAYAAVGDLALLFGIILNEHAKPASVRELTNAAIDGMLSTLDPHSIHMEPEIFKEMKVNTRGSFGGLGIVISIRDGQLTIISPIKDTPASRAALTTARSRVRVLPARRPSFKRASP